MLSDANDGSSGESFVTKTVHSPLRQPDPSHHVTTERTVCKHYGTGYCTWKTYRMRFA